MTSARRARAWAVAVFAVTLAWNATLGLSTRPTGPREDHFGLGQRLYRTGTLAAGTDPGVLKAPGFPLFVTAVLHARDAVARVLRVGPDALESSWTDERAVMLAQCIAWAAAAAAIFAALVGLTSVFEAGCLALAFGCGPFGIALVGALTYPALHIVATTFGTLTLIRALRQTRSDVVPPLLTGVVWGLATLVRPVSLVLPPFVLLLARLRRAGGWLSAALFTTLFTLGLGAVILPYAVRNSLQTGRPMLINAQGGIALWSATAQRLRPDQKWLNWRGLWRRHGLPLFREVTGEQDHAYGAMRSHAAELNRVFTRQAWTNIREQPAVYLYNVQRQLVAFVLDPFEYWPSRFARRNDMAKRARRTADTAVCAFTVGLMLLSLPGLVLGLWRRDLAAWTLFLVFAMLALAHALTLVQGSYTYPKLPLLILASGLTLHHLAHRRQAGPAQALVVRVCRALALAVAVGAVLCTATLVLLGNP